MVSKLKRPPRIGENFCQLYIRQGTDNQNIQGAHKTELTKNQRRKKGKAFIERKNEVNNRTEQNLFKGRSPNGQNTHEKMFNIPSQKEMQIKTNLKFHLTSVRIATIKNTTNNKCCHGYRKKGTLTHCWWNVN
jgi:hypothetical protein